MIRPIPHGMGGLKFKGEELRKWKQGPIPHGMGGLKCPVDIMNMIEDDVPSHTGWVD